MATFPFSALVGQGDLKKALLLGVIQPALGGVLIRGTKGIAKSTAVRALAALLPPIEAVAGCPYQGRPGEVIAGRQLPVDAPVVSRPVPLVELPLGTTEDRLLGALHLERALRGERAFEPGLLAAANRGILYIDEVNLLPDHLVDILLDTSASGVHRLEREGLSLVHPARFLLVGTMNPEEGELRPQLLDRFGLAADLTDLADPAERAEAVRRRLAFEADPDRFGAQWRPADVELARRVVEAQLRLGAVRISDELLQAVSQRCLAAGVEGLRADLTLCQSACAWAAFQGRTDVQAADIDAVAELALAHRRRTPPGGGGERDGSRMEDRGSRIEDRGSKIEERGMRSPSSILDPRSSILDPRSSTSIFDIAGAFRVQARPTALQQSVQPGRWRSATPGKRGGSAGTAPRPQTGGLDWSASLRAAAPRQVERGRSDGRLILRADDLRWRRQHMPAGCLLLFVVDTSGSMAARRRMRQSKAAILALLQQAYRQRDRVALLAFCGAATELVLPPTRGLEHARRELEKLPVGGTTPLAHGLATARRFLLVQQRRQPRLPVWTVLLTDGRANVGLAAKPATGSAWQDALQQARLLAQCAAEFLVIDTEVGWPRFGGAARLARVLGAPCLPLDDGRAAGSIPAGSTAGINPAARLAASAAARLAHGEIAS